MEGNLSVSETENKGKIKHFTDLFVWQASSVIPVSEFVYQGRKPVDVKGCVTLRLSKCDTSRLGK